MATLRNTAISLLLLAGHTKIATALRHHGRSTSRPIELCSPHERLCRPPAPRPKAGLPRRVEETSVQWCCFRRPVIIRIAARIIVGTRMNTMATSRISFKTDRTRRSLPGAGVGQTRH